MREATLGKSILVSWKEASRFVLKLSRTWFGKASGPPYLKAGATRTPSLVKVLNHFRVEEVVHQQKKQIYLDWRVGSITLGPIRG